MVEENQEVHRQNATGVVVSNSMNKSIVVKVERRVPHPLYKKIITLSKKFHAHDEENTCNVGDTVKIVACRPLSKTKTWRLDEIVERSR